MEEIVAILGDILEANRKFVRPGAFPPLPKKPKKQIAVFTCMDTRLVDFLEPAMGIRRGDAKVIKNAGNTIIDPNGGVIRSLVVAIFTLGQPVGSGFDNLIFISQRVPCRRQSHRKIAGQSHDPTPDNGCSVNRRKASATDNSSPARKSP
jgi:hypothetical protein